MTYYLRQLIIFAGFITACTNIHAMENSQRFGDYDVSYTILSSTFIKPEIANAHSIKRSRYEVLLNVAVTPVKFWGGIPVTLNGTTKNMLQQQKTLKFKTINEDNVTYYLAPIRVSKKEIIHFTLNVTLPNETDPRQLTFTRTLHAD